MVYKRKKTHRSHDFKKRFKTKHKSKDLDEIDEDLQVNADILQKQEIDVDKPGQAQFYCIHCARYFVNDHALKDHFKTKVHKRRMKALELEPYSIEDSEKAAGLGNFKVPIKRKIETLPQQQKQDENITDPVEPSNKKTKKN